MAGPVCFCYVCGAEGEDIAFETQTMPVNRLTRALVNKNAALRLRTAFVVNDCAMNYLKSTIS